MEWESGVGGREPSCLGELGGVEGGSELNGEVCSFAGDSTPSGREAGVAASPFTLEVAGEESFMSQSTPCTAMSLPLS